MSRFSIKQLFTKCNLLWRTERISLWMYSGLYRSFADTIVIWSCVWTTHTSKVASTSVFLPISEVASLLILTVFALFRRVWGRNRNWTAFYWNFMVYVYLCKNCFSRSSLSRSAVEWLPSSWHMSCYGKSILYLWMFERLRR